MSFQKNVRDKSRVEELEDKLRQYQLALALVLSGLSGDTRRRFQRLWNLRRAGFKPAHRLQLHSAARNTSGLAPQNSTQLKRPTYHIVVRPRGTAAKDSRMALSRATCDDTDFFANPFRMLLDPRFLAPNLLGAPANGTGTELETSPIRVDVLEKEDKFTVKANIPGVPKSKVNLSVDGDVLTLSVKNSTQQEKDEEMQGYKVHRMERSTAFTRRAIRMPDSADTEKISARVEQGVLEVDIPKKQAAQLRKRQIAIEGEETQPAAAAAT